MSPIQYRHRRDVLHVVTFVDLPGTPRHVHVYLFDMIVIFTFFTFFIFLILHDSCMHGMLILKKIKITIKHVNSDGEYTGRAPIPLST